MAKKSRYWGFILYPDGENTPKLWLDILINTKLKIVISPLHDHDQWSNYDIERKKEYCNKNNIKAGELKKPHYHVLICHTNTTTEQNMLNILNDINITYIEPISSVIGQYDYFTHKHNDDKYKYNEKDIKTYNGFNIMDYVELSSKENQQLKIYVIEFILERDINHYDDLINQLLRFEMYDELNIAMNNTIFFNNYIKSKYNRIADMKKSTDIVVKPKTVKK